MPVARRAAPITASPSRAGPATSSATVPSGTVERRRRALTLTDRGHELLARTWPASGDRRAHTFA
ncbi:hypothetical protein [Streptomyces sp. NPDC048191]|uniref:hypothetical protein n=1 Tax=Streptomyces sp. NPDC048191 TaxID=3155484 RepID=UPI0033D73CBC